jgi:hypothetical protein
MDSKSDTSLFIYQRSTDIVYLLLYIDDIVLTTSHLELLQHTITALQQEFAMEDLGPLHHFLDVSVEHLDSITSCSNTNTLWISSSV